MVPSPISSKSSGDFKKVLDMNRNLTKVFFQPKGQETSNISDALDTPDTFDTCRLGGIHSNFAAWEIPYGHQLTHRR